MSKGFSYHFSGTMGHIIEVAASLPRSHDTLLDNGWNDISIPTAAENGHFTLEEASTGLRVRFNRKVEGAPGFRGKDHYHIFNPDATGNHDLYLDALGNPVSKKSKASHILPEGGKDHENR